MMAPIALFLKAWIATQRLDGATSDQAVIKRFTLWEPLCL